MLDRIDMAMAETTYYKNQLRKVINWYAVSKNIAIGDSEFMYEMCNCLGIDTDDYMELMNIGE